MRGQKDGLTTDFEKGASKPFGRLRLFPKRRELGDRAKDRVTIIGSWTRAVLPRDIALYFKDGICIDRRNGTPMEMDAYSIYLALKAIEQRDAVDCSSERQTLVDAVLARKDACGGFWKHGAWTGSEKETHMRFSAAAIRLLVEAFKDGLICDPSTVIGAILRHTEYSEDLNCGTWYLHDSLECPSTGIRHPDRIIRNTAYGSSETNCLVLNTHIDTLVTILNVLQDVGASDGHRRLLISRLNAGLRALDYVLQPDATSRWQRFAGFDSAFRARLFASYAHDSPFTRGLRRFATRWYFFRRQEKKSKFPRFCFPDGYLERDISLPGIHFDYHVVNAYDFARLLAAIGTSGLSVEPDLLDRLRDLTDRALDYAVGGPYWTYVMARMIRTGTAALLCEAILCRLSTKDSVPKPWIDAYCAIRRTLPPTAALLGFDPIIVDGIDSVESTQGTRDIVRLRGGGRLTVDIATNAFTKERGKKGETSEFKRAGHLV